MKISSKRHFIFIIIWTISYCLSYDVHGRTGAVTDTGDIVNYTDSLDQEIDADNKSDVTVDSFSTTTGTIKRLDDFIETDSIQDQINQFKTSIIKIADSLEKARAAHRESLQENINKINSLDDNLLRRLDTIGVKFNQLDTIQEKINKHKTTVDKFLDKADTLETELSEVIKNLRDTLKLPENISGEIINLKEADFIEHGISGKNINPDGITNTMNLNKDLLDRLKSGEERIKNLQEKANKVSDSGADYKEKLNNVDSEIDRYAQNRQEIKALKEQETKMKSEQQKLIDKNDEILSTAEKVKDIKKIKADFREKLNERLTESLVDHQQLVKSAQEQVNKYKRNPYYKFGNNEMLKKNSFKNVPMNKRFAFGINMQIASGNPLIMNVAPQITYLFMPEFRFGIGAIYSIEVNVDDRYKLSARQINHGYKSFIEWDGLKKVFVHCEYELRSEFESSSTNDEIIQNWKQYFLAGIGKQISINSLVKGSMMLLYNVNHNNGTSYASPWVFRIGAEINTSFIKKKSK